MKKLINIKNAKEEFLKYTKLFDLSNSNINRKQGHSLRVMEISKKIAESGSGISNSNWIIT